MAESGIKESESAESPIGELDAPIWSVISFERCEGSGLIYMEAVRKMNQLATEHVSGLCIVTDDAAARLRS